MSVRDNPKNYTYQLMQFEYKYLSLNKRAQDQRVLLGKLINMRSNVNNKSPRSFSHLSNTQTPMNKQNLNRKREIEIENTALLRRMLGIVNRNERCYTPNANSQKNNFNYFNNIQQALPGGGITTYQNNYTKTDELNKTSNSVKNLHSAEISPTNQQQSHRKIIQVGSLNYFIRKQNLNQINQSNKKLIKALQNVQPTLKTENLKNHESRINKLKHHLGNVRYGQETNFIYPLQSSENHNYHSSRFLFVKNPSFINIQYPKKNNNNNNFDQSQQSQQQQMYVGRKRSELARSQNFQSPTFYENFKRMQSPINSNNSNSLILNETQKLKNARNQQKRLNSSNQYQSNKHRKLKKRNNVKMNQTTQNNQNIQIQNQDEHNNTDFTREIIEDSHIFDQENDQVDLRIGGSNSNQKQFSKTQASFNQEFLNTSQQKNIKDLQIETNILGIEIQPKDISKISQKIKEKTKIQIQNNFKLSQRNDKQKNNEKQNSQSNLNSDIIKQYGQNSTQNAMNQNFKHKIEFQQNKKHQQQQMITNESPQSNSNNNNNNNNNNNKQIVKEEYKQYHIYINIKDESGNGQQQFQNQMGSQQNIIQPHYESFAQSNGKANNTNPIVLSLENSKKYLEVSHLSEDINQSTNSASSVKSHYGNNQQLQQQQQQQVIKISKDQIKMQNKNMNNILNEDQEIKLKSKPKGKDNPYVIWFVNKLKAMVFQIKQEQSQNILKKKQPEYNIVIQPNPNQIDTANNNNNNNSNNNLILAPQPNNTFQRQITKAPFSNQQKQQIQQDQLTSTNEQSQKQLQQPSQTQSQSQLQLQQQVQPQGLKKQITKMVKPTIFEKQIQQKSPQDKINENPSLRWYLHKLLRMAKESLYVNHNSQYSYDFDEGKGGSLDQQIGNQLQKIIQNKKDNEQSHQNSRTSNMNIQVTDVEKQEKISEYFESIEEQKPPEVSKSTQNFLISHFRKIVNQQHEKKQQISQLNKIKTKKKLLIVIGFITGLQQLVKKSQTAKKQQIDQQQKLSNTKDTNSLANNFGKMFANKLNQDNSTQNDNKNNNLSNKFGQSLVSRININNIVKQNNFNEDEVEKESNQIINNLLEKNKKSKIIHKQNVQNLIKKVLKIAIKSRIPLEQLIKIKLQKAIQNERLRLKNLNDKFPLKMQQNQNVKQFVNKIIEMAKPGYIPKKISVFNNLEAFQNSIKKKIFQDEVQIEAIDILQKLEQKFPNFKTQMLKKKVRQQILKVFKIAIISRVPLDQLKIKQVQNDKIKTNDNNNNVPESLRNNQSVIKFFNRIIKMAEPGYKPKNIFKFQAMAKKLKPHAKNNENIPIEINKIMSKILEKKNLKATKNVHVLKLIRQIIEIAFKSRISEQELLKIQQSKQKSTNKKIPALVQNNQNVRNFIDKILKLAQPFYNKRNKKTNLSNQKNQQIYQEAEQKLQTLLQQSKCEALKKSYPSKVFILKLFYLAIASKVSRLELLVRQQQKLSNKNIQLKIQSNPALKMFFDKLINYAQPLYVSKDSKLKFVMKSDIIINQKIYEQAKQKLQQILNQNNCVNLKKSFPAQLIILKLFYISIMSRISRIELQIKQTNEDEIKRQKIINKIQNNPNLKQFVDKLIKFAQPGFRKNQLYNIKKQNKKVVTKQEINNDAEYILQQLKKNKKLNSLKNPNVQKIILQVLQIAIKSRIPYEELWLINLEKQKKIKQQMQKKQIKQKQSKKKSRQKVAQSNTNLISSQKNKEEMENKKIKGEQFKQEINQQFEIFQIVQKLKQNTTLKALKNVFVQKLVQKIIRIAIISRVSEEQMLQNRKQYEQEKSRQKFFDDLKIKQLPKMIIENQSVQNFFSKIVNLAKPDYTKQKNNLFSNNIFQQINYSQQAVVILQSLINNKSLKSIHNKNVYALVHKVLVIAIKSRISDQEMKQIQKQKALKNAFLKMVQKNNKQNQNIPLKIQENPNVQQFMNKIIGFAMTTAKINQEKKENKQYDQNQLQTKQNNLKLLMQASLQSKLMLNNLIQKGNKSLQNKNVQNFLLKLFKYTVMSRVSVEEIKRSKIMKFKISLNKPLKQYIEKILRIAQKSAIKIGETKKNRAKNIAKNFIGSLKQDVNKGNNNQNSQNLNSWQKMKQIQQKKSNL